MSKTASDPEPRPGLPTPSILTTRLEREQAGPVFQWPPPQDGIIGEVAAFPDDPSQLFGDEPESSRRLNQGAPDGTTGHLASGDKSDQVPEGGTGTILFDVLSRPAETSLGLKSAPAARPGPKPAPVRPMVAVKPEPPPIPATVPAVAGAGLRSRAVAAAFALLALVAGLEAAYILRPGLLGLGANRGAPPASGAGAASAVASAVPAGRPIPVPKQGRLNIRSEPAGAAVSIDGKSSGVTPLDVLSVAAGDHDVLLSLDGRQVRETVHVDAGGTVSFVAPLPAAATAVPAGVAATGPGWVAITSPLELDLLEGGVVLGTTRSPQVMLAAGTHNLSLTNEATGFKAVQQVRVQPGRVARIQVALPQSLVHLNALPWAEVSVDGKAVGETPIGNLPLTIGLHKIVFHHPELGDKTMSTLVKAGEPTRVTADMRR